MTEDLHIQLLGGLVLRHGDAVITTVQSPQEQSLLAYLLLHGGVPQDRQHLAFLFWPDSTESQARGQLRKALFRLRRDLPDAHAYLMADAQTVLWRSDAPYTLDVKEFERALERAERCLTHGDQPGERAALEQAVGLSQGDLLPSCYDDWILPERTRLQHETVYALERLIAFLENARQYDSAIAYAQRLLNQDPLHEPGSRALMRLYALSGNRAGALRTYQQCVTMLREELAVDPSPETVSLYERIRDGEELAGAHAAPAHNLPAETTPFIGRKAALDEIAERLQDPNCRLLSLVGPGGCGKTRLALEAARQQFARVEERVLWVPLAQVGSVEGMVSAVAQAGGYSTYRASDPWQRLLDDLRDRRMLIVLDNLEHLLDTDHAAGRSAVDLINAILRAAPGVRILTTSRARPNVQSECLLPVSGMAYPRSPSRPGEGQAEDGIGWGPAQDKVTPSNAAGYDAVRLFLMTAHRVRPGFEPNAEELSHVVRICRLVGGMPLAILLAAAWMEMLSPAEIVAELKKGYDLLRTDLRDLPERHRSIEAVFDASWQMLDDEERETFARLSIFRGGFTWEAAQQVVGPGLPTLFSLVHKSFLQRYATGRYEAHELLQQYAELKLSKHPEERARIADLHCAYYGQLALRAGRWGGLLIEIDNLRAGWRWAVSRARYADIARYGGSFTLYLYQGLYPEGIESLEWAAGVLRPHPAREVSREEGIALGIVLIELGRIYQMRDPGARVELREQLVAEGVSLLRQRNARQELARMAHLVAWTFRLERDSEAVQVVEEGLAFYREQGDLAGVAFLLAVLGELAIRRGAYDEAEQLSREALRIGEESASGFTGSYPVFNLAKIAYFRGEYERAKQGYQEALDLLRSDAPDAFVAEIGSFLADAVLAMGNYQEAREYHGRIEALSREMALPWAEVASGQHHGLAYSLLRLGDIALALGEIEQASEHYRQVLEIARDHPCVTLNLDAVVSQAALLAGEGHGEQALELAALVLHHPAGYVEVKKRAQRLLDQLEAELPPDVLAGAQERGRAQDLEETVKELLAESEGDPLYPSSGTARG